MADTAREDLRILREVAHIVILAARAGDGAALHAAVRHLAEVVT